MDTFAQPLDVTIKRIDKGLPLPTYATSGSVGFDLLCREDTEIAPRKLGLIPGNVVVRTPPGYMLLLTMRSRHGEARRAHCPGYLRSHHTCHMA